MTVSTITGIPADVKRALEQQNRNPNFTIEKAPSQASLPQDVLTASTYTVETLDVPAAIVATQTQNRDAAKSVLNDADIAQIEVQESASERVAAQPSKSVAAQTAKLPADLLKLISE